MQYDFTSKIDRTNTGSNKWRLMFETDPNVDSDVLPLSVADCLLYTSDAADDEVQV